MPLSPTERFRLDLLTSLVHEGRLAPLAMWLADAPPWAEELVSRLLEDRLVFLFTSGDSDDVVQRIRDPQARLPDAERRALLATPAARSAYDVCLAPTDDACDRFSEDQFAVLFAYIADPPEAD